MEIPGHLWFALNLCFPNAPVRSKCISTVNWQIRAAVASVSVPRSPVSLVRSLFVTVNDVDCNRIITADLSLSHLLGCLPSSPSFLLSVTFSSIEALFEPSVESKSRVVSARQRRFACAVHKAPEKATLRGGGVEIHKHTHLNHTLTDRRPTLFVCNL